MGHHHHVHHHARKHRRMRLVLVIVACLLVLTFLTTEHMSAKAVLEKTLEAMGIGAADSFFGEEL